MTLHNSVLMQDAASEGLLRPEAEAWIHQNNERIKRVAIWCVPWLKDCNIDVRPPDAALYIWSPLPDGYTDSIAFAAEILENTGVAVAPGRGGTVPER